MAAFAASEGQGHPRILELEKVSSKNGQWALDGVVVCCSCTCILLLCVCVCAEEDSQG